MQSACNKGAVSNLCLYMMTDTSLFCLTESGVVSRVAEPRLQWLFEPNAVVVRVPSHIARAYGAPSPVAASLSCAHPRSHSHVEFFGKHSTVWYRATYHDPQSKIVQSYSYIQATSVLSQLLAFSRTMKISNELMHARHTEQRCT